MNRTDSIRNVVKDVYKVPQLDLMGWFTNAPPSGPSPAFLPIHRHILKLNDSAVLLTFHPSLIGEQSSSRGKLPLTIYETVSEEDGVDILGADEMDDADESLKIKLREVPYSIETGEAEMISVDFVARGGGSAAVTGKQSQENQKPSPGRTETDVKEKRTPSEKEVNGTGPESILTPDEEDCTNSYPSRSLAPPSNVSQ
jgi:COP9 signalosome complex subunit 6